MAARNTKMDNFRGILMILVVLGHLMELETNGKDSFLYLFIYMFHMPLFVWSSGCYAKRADSRCLRTLLLPYFLFQLLYSFFAIYVWKTETDLKLLEPYWLMWFIMALFFWRIFLPLVDFSQNNYQIAALGIVILLSLCTGWEDELRYVLSFQRAVALAPFFLMGYYYHNGMKERFRFLNQRLGHQEKALIHIVLVLVFLCCLGYVYMLRDSQIHKWLYWKYPYGVRGGNFFSRLALTCAGISALVLFYPLIPSKVLPLLTRIGRNTLPVYLLHGLVVKTLEAYEVYEKLSFLPQRLLSLFFCIGLVWLFSLPKIGDAFRLAFRGGTRGQSKANFQ